MARRDLSEQDRPTGNDLYHLAMLQKILLFCVLGYLICIGATLTSQYNQMDPVFITTIRLVGAATILSAVVVVFLITNRLDNLALAIIFAILTLVPCLGLFMMLIVNLRTTDALKRAGIYVGFMGANLSEIERTDTPYRKQRRRDDDDDDYDDYDDRPRRSRREDRDRREGDDRPRRGERRENNDDDSHDDDRPRRTRRYDYD